MHVYISSMLCDYICIQGREGSTPNLQERDRRSPLWGESVWPWSAHTTLISEDAANALGGGHRVGWEDSGNDRFAPPPAAPPQAGCKADCPWLIGASPVRG